MILKYKAFAITYTCGVCTYFVFVFWMKNSTKFHLVFLLNNKNTENDFAESFVLLLKMFVHCQCFTTTYGCGV